MADSAGSARSIRLGPATFAAALALTCLWKSKLRVPAVMLGSAAASAFLFAGS